MQNTRMSPSAKISTRSPSVCLGKLKNQSSEDSTDLPSWTALSPQAKAADTSDEDEVLVDELRLSPVSSIPQPPGIQSNSRKPVALNGTPSTTPSTGTTTPRFPPRPPGFAPGTFLPSQSYAIINNHGLPIGANPSLPVTTTPSQTSRAIVSEAEVTTGLPRFAPLQSPISQSNIFATSPLLKEPLKPWEILDQAVVPIRKKQKISGTNAITFTSASQAPSLSRQQSGSPTKSANHYSQQTASSVVSSSQNFGAEPPPPPPPPPPSSSSGPSSSQSGLSTHRRVQTRNRRPQKPPPWISDADSAEWKRVDNALETHVGSVRILPQYAHSAKNDAAEVSRLHVALRNYKVDNRSKGKGRAQPGWTHSRWSNVGEFKERLDLFYGPGDINRGLGKGPRNAIVTQKNRPETEENESVVAPESEVVDAPDTMEVPGTTLTEDEEDTEAILQGMRRGRLENPSPGKGSRPTQPRAAPGTSPEIV